MAAAGLLVVGIGALSAARVHGSVNGPAPAMTAATSDSVAVAVFEGRTPCGQIAVEFTGFGGAGCEKVKWQFTFFVDAATRRPSAFLYQGTRTTRSGTWTIQKGRPSDPTAQVYRLTPTAGKVISLLAVDENVLLLLDAQLRVVTGDASWSYAFNRTDRKLSK